MLVLIATLHEQSHPVFLDSATSFFWIALAQKTLAVNPVYHKRSKHVKIQYQCEVTRGFG